jgi:hypothetical protein
MQVLTKDEGGRYTPFMENYRPQLFLRTADITVAVTFPEGTADASEKMVRWNIYVIRALLYLLLYRLCLVTMSKLYCRLYMMLPRMSELGKSIHYMPLPYGLLTSF